MEENKKPSNPFAYPVYERNISGDMHLTEAGMTLRDYFAGQVIAEYVRDHLSALRENKLGWSVESMVDSSFVFADAMLKQREQ